MDTARTLAAALRKAGAVWVAPQGHPARLVWTIWQRQALWVAVGPQEQQVPGLADQVPCLVTIRSPSTHSHLIDVPVLAHAVQPDEEILTALNQARLNASLRFTEVFRLDPQ